MKQSVYDLLGPEGYAMLYPEHLRSAEAEVNEWHQRIKMLGLPTTGSLLDIGCGLGERTAAWAANGYDVTGIDYCKSMLDAARRSFPEFNLVELDALQCSRLGSFDMAVAHFNFLMMMPTSDVAHLLRELRSSISPEGGFITELTYPIGKPVDFQERWTINGRTLTEVGKFHVEKYQHEWFDGTRRVCKEDFWFRSNEAYEALAESTGWSVRFIERKQDASKRYALAVFSPTKPRSFQPERNLTAERR